MHLCYGFFSHSRWFRWWPKLDRSSDHYTVWSDYEAKRYRLPPDRTHVVLYSDWEGTPRSHGKHERYFVSAGYSDRDYPAMLELARRTPEETFVIICSKVNGSLGELPPNVRVIRDLPIEDFNRWIGGAVACILPTRNRKGPAGVSVAVGAMKHGTPVYATDTPIMREYVPTNQLFQHPTDLVWALRRLEPESERYREMVDRGHATYRLKCSKEAVTRKITAILGLSHRESRAA
jgi:glycosyltransferase involved in cell wall biosynthesis